MCCATTFAPPLPRLREALSNLGFGRNGAYGIQPAAPRCRSSAIAMRVAAIEHLDTIARLTLVELQHRSAPPVFAPRQDRPLGDLAAEHRALHDHGAVYLLATLDGCDADLLTIELTSPVPRLCQTARPTSAPPLPARRAAKASGTRSSTPRSAGHMPWLPMGLGRFRHRKPVVPAILAQRRLPPGRIRQGRLIDRGAPG